MNAIKLPVVLRRLQWIILISLVPITCLGASATTDVLVATPRLADGHFDRSVVLVVRHGTMRDLIGVILNRPLGTTLQEISSIEDDHPFGDAEIYHGGPVAPGALVAIIACNGRPDDALEIADGVYVSLNLNEIKDRWSELSVSNIRIFRGYTGWAPGQLEKEIERQSWKYEPMPTNQMFLEDTSNLWQQLNSQTIVLNF